MVQLCTGAEIHHEGHLVRYVIDDLQQGRLALFKDLNALQQQVLYKLSFNTLKNIYTPTFHQRFLAAISGEIMELTLQDNPHLTDSELIQLLQRLPRLTTLRLSNCQKIRGEPLSVGVDVLGLFTQQSIVSVCAEQGITTLHIQRCDNLQPVILEELHRHYGTRSTVQIQLEENKQLEASQIQPLAARYPHWGLAILAMDTRIAPTLSATLKRHTYAVYALGVLPDGRVVSGSHDKTLKLWSTSYAPLSTLLPTHAVRLTHNFTHLVNSGYLQEQHIHRLLNPQLTSLFLAHSPVNDRLLRIILNHCQQLQTLDISHCRWLTDVSIATLMQYPSLIQVTMADNTAISATNKQQLLTHLQQKSAGSATESLVVHYLKTLATPAQVVADEAVSVEQVGTSSIMKVRRKK